MPAFYPLSPGYSTSNLVSGIEQVAEGSRHAVAIGLRMVATETPQ